MPDYLTFLGTGGSEGVPVLGCTCDVCNVSRKNGGRHIRLRSSIFVHIHGKNLLVDASPDFHVQALRAGIEHLDAVFITHWNHDHCGGLLEFEYWNSLEPNRPKIKLFFSNYSMAKFEMFKSIVEQPERPPSLDGFDPQGIEPYYVAEVDDIKIMAVQTYHTNHSLAFVFEYDDKKLTYLLDSPYHMPDATKEIISDSDILIMDCTFYKKSPDILEDNKLYHMTFEQCVRLFKETKAKKGILSHISHRNLPHDELVQKAAKKNLIVAYDQLSMEI